MTHSWESSQHPGHAFQDFQKNPKLNKTSVMSGLPYGKPCGMLPQPRQPLFPSRWELENNLELGRRGRPNRAAHPGESGNDPT